MPESRCTARSLAEQRLVGVARNAIENSRKLKPQIPATGLYGIPVRDEIELEMIL